MNKLILALFISMLALMVWETAFAESRSYSISCTIPAIPGVNAPAIKEASFEQKTVEVVAENEAKKEMEDTSDEPAGTVQEESTKETMLAEGKTEQKTLYTLYSR
jgi:hypothetical protein